MPHFGKKKKRQEKALKKLMRTYIRDRIKQEKIFEKKLEKLEAQRQGALMDLDTYSRLSKLLEASFEKRREEIRANFIIP